MAMQALLNNGDEVLVPAPDYPLWTAAVSLGGGTPRHYLCDEGAGWLPDLDDIRGKITPQHARHRHHQSEQSDRRAVSDRAAAGNPGDRAPAPADRLCRRDLRQGAVRRRDAHLDRLAGRRCAVRHLQRPVEELPRLRLPLRLADRVGRKAPCQGLHRRPQHAGLDAPVFQRAGAVCDPDRAGRLPEHQRSGRAERAAVAPARSGARAADR